MKLKEYKSLNKQDNDTKLKEGMRLNELIAGWAGYNLSRDIDYEIKNVVQPYINENGNINPNVYIYSSFLFFFLLLLLFFIYKNRILKM